MTLTANNVGHAFPTGDLFRRLEITAEVLGPEQSSLASAVTYLTRRFVTTRSQGGLLRRTEVADNRLGVGADRSRKLRLSLGDVAEGRSITWRVAYQRVEHPGKLGQEDALLESEVELGRGLLAPATAKP